MLRSSKIRSSKLVRGLSFAAASALLATTLPAPLLAQNPLVTGKRITQPPLGASVTVGSLPTTMVLTPNGKYAVVADSGFNQYISVVDTRTGAVVSQSNLIPAYDKTGTYYGLAIQNNADGSAAVYTSQGASHAVAVYSLSVAGVLSATPTQTFVLTNVTDFPTGLAVAGGSLYVASSPSALPTTPSSLIVLNAATGSEIGRYNFPTPPVFPLSVAALADGSKVYVTSERDDAVYVFDTTSPASPTLVKTISLGAVSGTQSHPDALLFNKTQTRLYIAFAHADKVAAVDTATDAFVGAPLSLRPAGAAALPGATPTGLALSPDERTLYVTLADMNAVAVVPSDLSSVQGYVPTGWYPSAVVASPLRRQILVADAKGIVGRNPNPDYVTNKATPGNPTVNEGPQNNAHYSEQILQGIVQTIPVPNSVQLAQDTQQVRSNNLITGNTAQPANPLAAIGLAKSGITHVIYIVKENRTYDQVLGDLPQGNGDPSLALFGKDITPNQHALASRFVTLDNFYDCGEVSGDGWPWSTQAQANEFIIRDVPPEYNGRRANYDFEGNNNNYPTGGFPATDPYGAGLVDPGTPFAMGGPPITDVGEAPGGHIWDDVENSGLSFRNYGAFTSFGTTVNGKVVLPYNYPGGVGLRPVGVIPTTPNGTSADLSSAGHSDYDMRGYDQNFPDSDAPNYYYTHSDSSDPYHSKYLFSRTSFGHYNSVSRFSEFSRELAEMLKADPSGAQVPNFIVLKYSNDHTQGLATGTQRHSPKSGVADNDYAVGQTVDLISKTPALWDHTAIFVIEDDAQNGPDHVDCHRSTCYVISPYIKKNSVDHTFYNTNSAIKTMEQLLGIPPMNQYDATASTIQDFDTTPSNGEVYNATLPAPNIIGDLNPTLLTLRPGTESYRLAKLSNSMDFRKEDMAPAALLNEILWKSVRGMNSKVPAPRHNAKIEARLTLPKPGTGKKSDRDQD